MSNRVAVGVASPSWWAETMHLPALANHPEPDLVAICGRFRDRAIVIAAKYDVPNVYMDHRRMQEGGGLDALVVAIQDDPHPFLFQAGGLSSSNSSTNKPSKKLRHIRSKKCSVALSVYMLY